MLCHVNRPKFAMFLGPQRAAAVRIRIALRSHPKLTAKRRTGHALALQKQTVGMLRADLDQYSTLTNDLLANVWISATTSNRHDIQASEP